MAYILFSINVTFLIDIVTFDVYIPCVRETELVNNRSAYPQFFKTPEGRAVSIKKMAVALRTIRKNPDAEYPGWDWFPVPGHFIIRAFMDGVNDRINMRGAMQ